MDVSNVTNCKFSGYGTWRLRAEAERRCSREVASKIAFVFSGTAPRTMLKGLPFTPTTPATFWPVISYDILPSDLESTLAQERLTLDRNGHYRPRKNRRSFHHGSSRVLLPSSCRLRVVRIFWRIASLGAGGGILPGYSSPVAQGRSGPVRSRLWDIPN